MKCVQQSEGREHVTIRTTVKTISSKQIKLIVSWKGDALHTSVMGSSNHSGPGSIQTDILCPESNGTDSA